MPKLKCDLLFPPVPFSASWNHLSDVSWVDPSFVQPGRIDILLGVNVYGRWGGALNAPVVFEIEFGWVLARNAGT